MNKQRHKQTETGRNRDINKQRHKQTETGTSGTLAACEKKKSKKSTKKRKQMGRQIDR